MRLLVRRLIANAALSSIFAVCVAQNTKSFTGSWNESRAREIALQVSQAWDFSNEKDFQGNPATGLQRNVYAVLPFDREGSARWLVLLAVNPAGDTCHACAPVTGGVIFRREGSVWNVSYDQSEIVTLGANGQPAHPRLQLLGAGKPAIAFEQASMAQGSEATVLTLVAEIKDRLTPVLSIQTAGSNKAAEMPPEQTFQWRARVQVGAAGSSEFPDVEVSSSGSRQAEDGQKVARFSTVQVYRFSAGAYRPIMGHRGRRSP